MREVHRAIIIVLASAISLPAMAQAVDQTGTGAGPTSTAKAPHTAPSGQTVPNPSSIDPDQITSIQRRTRAEAHDDDITKGICIGCSD